MEFHFFHNKDMEGIRVTTIPSEPIFFTRIEDVKLSDPKVHTLARLDNGDNTSRFSFKQDGTLCTSRRFVVPEYVTLSGEILSQAKKCS